MKKLNNRGWGYRMMTLLMSILIIFLFIAIYYIYRFYNELAKTKFVYSTYEIKEKL